MYHNFNVAKDFVVYETNNPEEVKDFKTAIVVDGEEIEMNRELDKNHVKEIKNAILNYPGIDDLIPELRLVVYNGIIIVADGNHTLNAFRLAWAEGSTAVMRFRFLKANPQTEEELRDLIIQMNNTQKKWGIKDIVRAYVNARDESISFLNNFAESHSLCRNRGKENGKPSIRYAGAFFRGENVTRAVRNKTFVALTDEEKKYGVAIYPEVEALVGAVNWTKNNWLETFIQGWWKVGNNPFVREVLDKYSFDAFVEYVKNNSMTWEQKPSRDYWENIFISAVHSFSASQMV